MNGGSAAARRGRSLSHINIERAQPIVANMLGVDSTTITVTVFDTYEDVDVQANVGDLDSLDTVTDTVTSDTFTDTASTKLGLGPITLTTPPYVAATTVGLASPPPEPPSPPLNPGEVYVPGDDDAQETEEGGGGAAIIGVVIALIVIAVLLFLCYALRHRKQREERLAKESSTHFDNPIYNMSSRLNDGSNEEIVEDSFIEAPPALKAGASSGEFTDVAADEDENEKYRRSEWIRYYVEHGDEQKAVDLGWDGLPLPARPAAGAAGASSCDSFSGNSAGISQMSSAELDRRSIGQLPAGASLGDIESPPGSSSVEYTLPYDEASKPATRERSLSPLSKEPMSTDRLASPQAIGTADDKTVITINDPYAVVQAEQNIDRVRENETKRRI